MSRVFTLVPLCLMLMAGTAFGTVPNGSVPPVPGGWGNDCTQWINYYNEWDSGEMCYDPDLGSGGAGWRVCSTGGPVVWPPLSIELWIEMECLIHWYQTEAQAHRASDYSDLELIFCGYSKCNNGQWIITTPPTGGSLATLPFVEDMFHRTGPAYGTNIPLTWWYSVDGSDWAPMVDGTAGAKQFQVGLCDHNWCVKVVGDIVYHQEDGYYYLGGPGCFICPAEPL